jgi:hypothetical protein|tara:strand:- start:720 stop:8885 length:8166 start_codon:yes stop_codon:yes gene_type:complete
MNEELLQMVEGMLANNATQEEVNQAVAEFQSRPEVTTEPESIEQMDPETGSLYMETNNTGEDDRLLSMVQGMLENNATQEEINQEVAAFKNHLSKMEKPEVTVEETAPVVAEDTELQSEDTSSELLGKVVRVKRKDAPNGYDEYSYEEIEKQIANKDFRPGQKPFESVEAYVEAFKGKAQLVDLTGSDSSALVDSKDRKPVDVVDFEEGPSVPVDDFVEDVDAIQGFEKINKLTFEEDNNLVENYVNSEEYAQDASFITEGINFNVEDADLERDILDRYTSNFGKNDPFIANFNESILDLKEKEIENKKSELEKKYKFNESTQLWSDQKLMKKAQEEFHNFQTDLIYSAKENSVGYQSRVAAYRNSFNKEVENKQAIYQKQKDAEAAAKLSEETVDKFNEEMHPLFKYNPVFQATYRGFGYVTDEASVVEGIYNVAKMLNMGTPGVGGMGELQEASIANVAEHNLKLVGHSGANTFEGKDDIIKGVAVSSYTPVRIESAEYKEWLATPKKERDYTPPSQFVVTVQDTKKMAEAGQYTGSTPKRFKVNTGSGANSQTQYFDTILEATAHYSNKGAKLKERFAEATAKSKSFQAILDKLESSPEFTDENGDYDSSKFSLKNIRKVVGVQGVQMLSSVLTLGLGTYGQEAGAMFEEVLRGQAKKKYGDAFGLMSEDEQINAYMQMSKDGEIDYNEIQLSAAQVGMLDGASTLFGIKAAGAVSGSIFKNVIRGNLLGAGRETARVGKNILKAGLLEVPTEAGQELISSRTINAQVDDMTGMYLTGEQVKQMKEVSVHALFGSTGITTMGNVSKRGINHISANIGKYRGKYKIRKDVKAAISELNEIAVQSEEIIQEKLANGKITKQEAAQSLADLKSGKNAQLTAIYEAENIVSGSKYKNYEDGPRREMLSSIIDRQALNEEKGKIINEANQIKQDGFYSPTDKANTEGRLKVIDDQLNDLKKNEQKIHAKQHYLYSGKKMREYINNNPDKFNSSKAYTFKTRKEAEQFFKRKFGKDFDPSSDPKYARYGELLDNKIYGFRDDSNNLIIDVEENIFNNEDVIDSNLVGSNVVHHEGAHAIMSTLSDFEVGRIREQLQIYLEATNDPKLQALLIKVGVREGVSGRNINQEDSGRISDEEFIASVSDILRTFSIQEGDVESSANLSKIGTFIANSLNNAAPEGMDFSGLANGAQVLEFLQKYNQFNGTSNFKFNPLIIKSKDIPEEDDGVNLAKTNIETVASEKITKDVFFEDGSINKEFQQYTYDGKKNNAPSSFHAQAAYAYEPLAQGVVANISKSGFGISKDQDQFIIEYFNDENDGVSRKEAFVSDLTFGPDKNKASSLLGIAKSFNPAIGSFGGHAKAYLAVRAIRVFEERTSKQVTEGAQTLDAPESMQVAGEDQQIDTTDTRSTSERLGFDDTIKTEAMRVVKQAVQDTSNKLSGKDLSDKKKANLKKKSFDKFIEDRILPLVKTAIGKNTKTEKAFTNFVSKPDNFEVLRDIFLDQIDVQKGSGPAALWNIDNPPSLEEFLDYYEGSGTTKSDRRSSLARAVSRSIASEARLEFAKKDPATAKLFKEEHGVVLASGKISQELPKIEFQTLAGIAGFKDGAYNPAQSYWKAAEFDSEIGYDWGTDGGQNKFIKNFKFAVKKGLPLNAFMTQSKLFNSPRQLKELNSLRDKAKRALEKNPTAENKAAYNQADFDRAAMSKTFRGKLDEMLSEIKKEGNYSVLTGDGENWTAKNFITHLGDNPKDIQAKWDDGTIKQFNKSNLSMFEQTMGSLYDLVYKDPSMAQLAFALSPTSYGTSGWFRFGAEVVGYSKDLTSTKDRAIEWEHAMQANNARIFLINSAVNKVPWSTVYPAVKRNYKVIGLDKAYDDVLKAANRGNNMGIGWNVYTGHWTQRYFDPHVVAQGGIDPTTIVDFNGQNFADKYQIDSNGHSTKAMASAKLNEDFNNMLERVKGVKSEAVYSEDRANKIASGKKGLKFFVPYSAEDFVGLIYPTLGKGKEGDRNLQWYKDNLLDPYAIAMSNFEKAKQEAMRDWADLKKKIKSTPAALGKDAVRGFSNEEALRVYLWDQIGAVPSTLAQKDVDALVAHIEGNKTLKDFADNVNTILGAQGYPAPTGDWLAGTLTTDLINNVNTVKRAEFLQQWKDNVDVVYSKDNMNKLKAIYGERYIEALENILHRMETGRNRPGGGTRLENQWLDWVNNSVGTVMFFNTRSALLQTISSINFLNWSFNNPLMAAKAFANQPQFWKDFSSLFNSDFLKQRRSGLKNDVNADEIAKAAASSTNKVKAAMAAILKAGFLPTQMADSFAIAIGGASFYRNRVNSLVKEGMTKEQAMEQAMIEFQETAEESQQSSRPDRVSMQQAGGLGRVVLAFANTPMQYTRLTKKAALDLVNGRGDWKTNMSKLLYYGAVQNIIFTALQQAMFAMAFDDESDEDEKEAMAKIANGVADTLLRGTGVYGAAATTVKNIILEAIKQQKSKRTDYTKAALKSLTLSPPIDTKVRKLMSAARAFTYKQSLKDMKTKGASVDNPAALAAGQVISAAANVPIDRFIIKARNIKGALDQQNETWQQIALALGYSEWQLGIEKDKSDEAKPIKYVNPRSKVRKGTTTKSRSRVRRPPTKRLDDGIAGVANRDGTIEVDPNLSPVEHEKTVAHEEQHVKDMDSGKLDYDDKYVYWNDAKYARVNGKIKYKGKSYVEGHKSLPWEKVAYNAEPSTSAVKRKLY